MPTPISLITPVYNEEKILKVFLERLLTSTILPAEFIFVDAGSTDNSIVLVKEWKEKHPALEIKIIELPRAYPGRARNEAIKRASQEWIAFLDVGVLPEPNWLEEAYSFAQKNEAPAAWGVCRFSGLNPWTTMLCALSYGQGGIFPYFLSATLCHRSVFDKIGLFREELRSSEDVIWRNAFFKAYGKKYLCLTALVEYHFFPPTFWKAVKKWFIYAYFSARSKIYYPQQAVYFLFYSALTILLVAYPWIGLTVLFVYSVLRGVVLPMLKGRPTIWWGTHHLSLLLAPGVALALDLSKFFGFLLGTIKNLTVFDRSPQ
jgi:glycosyltransferase involved in cell wall biosynthesis